MISEDKRRNKAVWVRAGRGVVGLWVLRKAVSHWWVGCKFLVFASCVASWVARCEGWELIFSGEDDATLISSWVAWVCDLVGLRYL